MSFSVFALIAALFSSTAFADDLDLHNLHKIDGNSATGFEIYRSGAPEREDIQEWCRIGITEVYSLNGGADKYAKDIQELCPQIHILYNVSQKAKDPLTPEFLDQFDNWVQNAKVTGKKILIHCNCGCHRTGRLSAYYRIRFNQWTAEQSIQEMNDLGSFMFLYPYLPKEVVAFQDYVTGQSCSVTQRYCVPSRVPQLAAF